MFHFNEFAYDSCHASQLKFIYFACANRILFIKEVSVQIWKRKRLRFLLSIVMDVGDGLEGNGYDEDLSNCITVDDFQWYTYLLTHSLTHSLALFEDF